MPVRAIAHAVTAGTAMALAALGAAFAHATSPEPSASRIQPDAYAAWSGRDVVDEMLARHEQFAYVYEEQTMILTDAEGKRTARKLRRYSRAEADGEFKLLLVFDDPEEIRGVALLAVRSPNGHVREGVYLPAFGAELKRPSAGAHSGHFLGTDLAVEDLAAEAVDEHRYVRGDDRVIEDVDYFVVDAYPRDAGVEQRGGYGLRRHLVRKDNFIVARTDFFDRALRFLKRLTRHDLKRVDGTSWRADMIVVNDARSSHRTLIKVDRRVYSSDYVPARIFEPSYLLADRHLGRTREPGRSP